MAATHVTQPLRSLPRKLVVLYLFADFFPKKLAFDKGNIPTGSDIQWLRKGGGLLGKHASTGRYNLGEKTWYWRHGGRFRSHGHRLMRHPLGQGTSRSMVSTDGSATARVHARSPPRRRSAGRRVKLSATQHSHRHWPPTPATLYAELSLLMRTSA